MAMRFMNSSNLFKLHALSFRYINGTGVKKSFSSEHPKPFQSIPGLKALPIIGPIHNFLPFIGVIGLKTNMFEVYDILLEKFGPIVKIDGVYSRGTMVILFEPDHFDQVYRAEEKNSLRPGLQVLQYYREEMKKNSSENVYGLTTAQGPQWREFRTKVNPALLKPKLVKVYAPALKEISKDMVTRLVKLKDVPNYLQQNLDLELTKFSLESIAFVALGARLGCLGDNLTPDDPAYRLMNATKDVFECMVKLELRPNPWRYIATPSYKKIIKAFDTQWEISKCYINEARKRFEERGYDIPEEDKSILEKLLAIDEEVAVMMANDMLFAGIDTVAFVVTSILYHLAINPKVQDKLRDDIRSPNSNNRYLRACLKEALRIYHVVPANLRRTSREHVVGGYTIPEGIDVIAPNEFLSKKDKYYPQPLQYIPERWMVDKADPLYYGNAHPMVTLPFGFGVRSCIGRRIAELEIETLLKKLLDELKVSWEGPPIKIVNKLTNGFAKPYYFRFENAK